ncbi:hypothetical protein J6590_081901 [Homalodisca vitripennis]|nr:hypothetical protein J6590_081901 [Homalodisca vitripennis]
MEGVSQTLTKKLSTTSLTEDSSQLTTPQASVLKEGVSQTLTKKLSTTSLTEDPSQSTTPQATPTAVAPSNEKEASIINQSCGECRYSFEFGARYPSVAANAIASCADL